MKAIVWNAISKVLKTISYTCSFCQISFCKRNIRFKQAFPPNRNTIAWFHNQVNRSYKPDMLTLNNTVSDPDGPLVTQAYNPESSSPALKIWIASPVMRVRLVSESWTPFFTQLMLWTSSRSLHCKTSESPGWAKYDSISGLAAWPTKWEQRNKSELKKKK